MKYIMNRFLRTSNMKKNSFSIFALITFAISYLYFRLFAPQMMASYIEQGPAFLYTKDFIFGELFKFGGPAELLSKFIAQSYINPWLGSLALALFMVFIAYRIFTFSQERYSISIFLLALCASHIILAQGVLVHIIAISIIIFIFEDQEEAQLPNWLWIFRGIAFPLLLWTCGSWAWIYIIATIPLDIILKRKITYVHFLVLLYSIILGLIANFFIWPSSLLLSGLFIKTLPIYTIQSIVFLLGGIFAVFYSLMIKRETKTLRIILYILSAVFLLSTAIFS